MCIKLTTIAAALIALAACSAHAPRTESYLYPNFWGASPASGLGPPRKPHDEDLANTAMVPTDTSIFGTHVHSAYSPGIWLFPPDALDGGSN